jgi:hypothetical protein
MAFSRTSENRKERTPPPLAGGGRGRGLAPAGAHYSCFEIVRNSPAEAAAGLDCLDAPPCVDPSPYPLPQGEGEFFFYAYFPWGRGE